MEFTIATRLKCRVDGSLWVSMEVSTQSCDILIQCQYQLV